jgi:hypothetical protein
MIVDLFIIKENLVNALEETDILWFWRCFILDNPHS